MRAGLPEVRPGPPADDLDPPRADHPRLAELRQRYASFRSARGTRSFWTEERVGGDVDLRSFRSDNLYVWQDRPPLDPRARQFLTALDASRRCDPGWFSAMHEDGAYGAHTHTFEAFGCISRDLVDSIVELEFLARHVPEVARPGARVLDIGAGYGRLAHRASEVFPDLGRWYCTDAVPESTYLSEHYLAYRRVLSPDGPAEVIPLDELDDRLGGESLDVAVNVHSFSEMPRHAVRDWVAWLADHAVSHLFLVPNEAGDPTALEPDGSRPPLLDLFRDLGYVPAAVEPVVADPDVRSLVGLHDRLWLLSRDSGPEDDPKEGS